MEAESRQTQPTPEDPLTKRINEIGLRGNLEATHEVCRSFMEMTREGLALRMEQARPHLLQGNIHHDAALYVRGDSFTAPPESGNYVETLSIRVEPEDLDDPRYMRLHVPVLDSTTYHFQIPQLNEIQEVYVEDHGVERSRWYIVNRIGVREYIPDLEDNADNSTFEDKDVWEWVRSRVPKGLKLMERLSAQLIDWKSVPQNR